MRSTNYTLRPGGLAPSPQSFTVPTTLAGTRLDQALAQLLPQHSRSRIKGWIESGDVIVDGSVRAPRHRLAGGEAVTVCIPEPAADNAHEGQAIALAVVHEDASLLVIDKPAGLVVHPGAGNRDGTLLNALLHHAPELARVPRAGIVHRLDKDTSGLLVVARTVEAQTLLQRALAARQVSRRYLAIVYGDVERALSIDAPIGRHPTARTTMAVVATGRAALTHVTPRERYGVATLLGVALATGRTHQIRVHLAAVQHPLLGDPVYGGSRRIPGLPAMHRQALHAWQLAFDHPATGTPVRFRAGPPADFVALRDALRARAAASQAVDEAAGDDIDDD